jgi:Tol biopolymer transport system component
VLLIVGIVAVLVPNPARAQSSAWVSGNGVLAFRSDRDGEPDVFVVDPTGSVVTKLTQSHEVADLQPAFSPEGTRIAFVRRPNLTDRTCTS